MTRVAAARSAWAIAASSACCGAGGERRGGRFRRARRAIRLHRDRERLIEVVEAVAGVGRRDNRRCFEPLGALGCGRRGALLACQLDGVDGATAAEPGRRDHRAVAEHGA